MGRSRRQRRRKTCSNRMGRSRRRSYNRRQNGGSLGPLDDLIAQGTTAVKNVMNDFGTLPRVSSGVPNDIYHDNLN